MQSPATWISETFSSTASEDDLVKARSFNVTRIAGVVAPILAAIATAVGDLSDTPPFDEPGFQRQLILAFIGLIALVSVADILGRSIATNKVAAPLAVATPLPTPIKARKRVDAMVGDDVTGYVAAFRASNATTPGKSGEYLFLSDDGVASWEPAKMITLLSA
jgi:hypothetical protein